MLKIIADDLGIHESVNDGIIFLLKHGKINGTSLMAGTSAFDDAITKLRAVPGADIGVHLNFVEEKSLISGRLMSKNHRIFFIKYLIGLIEKDYIKKEAEAQIQKCIQAGIKPVFINGNQHLHLLPGIMDIIISLAREYDIPYIRIVNEPTSFKKGKLFRQLQLVFLNFLSKMAKNKIKNAGLQCNDYFIGFINAMNMDINDIELARELAKKYPDKIVELGCHPGFESNDLKIRFKHWGACHWQKESDLLKND